MSVARTCSLNREAKGSVITIRSNCCSISLREEMSNRVPTISCLPASPSHGPCSSKVELPEDQVNRWAAPSRERMASEREGSAAADEQSPRRGRLLITLVDARVTCGHDRHRDRGQGGCHASARPMGSDTAASPAIKMRRSPSRHPAAPARPGSAVALCVRTPRVRPCRPSVRWRDRPCRCRRRASRAPAQFPARCGSGA